MTRIAYLTIDDAPSASFLKKFEFLEDRKIKALWFCQGNYMEQRPEMMIRALQAGHLLGNHSYSHPRFSALSADQCFAEIRAADAVLAELHQEAGVPWTRKFFRFPYLDNASGSSVLEQILEGVAPTTPERALAVQTYLRRLGYEQPRFAGVTYDFYRQYVAAAVDVFGTYDSRDWSLGRAEEAESAAMMAALLERMDRDEPDVGLVLNDEASNDVVVLHDHDHHPGNHLLFQQMVGKILDKGICFDLPA